MMVTPELAMEWLANRVYSGQRPLKKGHVTFLAREMRNNTFIQGTQIHFARLEDRYYLVNGQHTLNAIFESETPTILTVHVTEVSTEDEVTRLYYHHDGGISRTNADTFRAVHFGERYNLNTKQVNTLAASAVYIENGFRTSIQQVRRTRDEVLQASERWATEMSEFVRVLGHRDNSKIGPFLRAAVVSVGLVTTRFQPESSKEFWQGMAENDGLRKSDPRSILRNYLFEHNLIRRDGSAKKTVDNEYMSRTVSQLWNAFYHNDELHKRPPVMNRMGPIKIAGTPYKGKVHTPNL
jgi:hypothetical protein